MFALGRLFALLQVVAFHRTRAAKRYAGPVRVFVTLTVAKFIALRGRAVSLNGIVSTGSSPALTAALKDQHHIVRHVVNDSWLCHVSLATNGALKVRL